jgi:hypothetical protein
MSATDFGNPHQIIHIPARDLTGTREAKLADLDMFLAQLQVVRLALCGEAIRVDAFVGAPDERRRNAHATQSWLARRWRALRRAFTSSAPPHANDGRS